MLSQIPENGQKIADANCFFQALHTHIHTHMHKHTNTHRQNKKKLNVAMSVRTCGVSGFLIPSLPHLATMWLQCASLSVTVTSSAK